MNLQCLMSAGKLIYQSIARGMMPDAATLKTAPQSCQAYRRSNEPLTHAAGATMPNQRMTLLQVQELAARVLRASGLDATGVAIIADLVKSAERDGPSSHGLAMLPRYQDALERGWANGKALPRQETTAPGILRVDGDNGFAQIASVPLRSKLIAMARGNGIALLTLRNCHHIGALRYDTEPLADAGLLAMAFVNSRPWIVPHGGSEPVFGTNPMSFACPRAGEAPVVWDQASSVQAISDIRLAASHGDELDRTVGVDIDGVPTQDPNKVLESGKLLSFAEHKGTAIALMVEVMASALTGAALSVEDGERQTAGATTAKAGFAMIAIDPKSAGASALADQVARIGHLVADNGAARVPGDGRLARRERAATEGVEVDAALVQRLQAVC